MLIPLQSLSLLLTISNMSVPVCNRFYATPANSGKITTFSGVPYLTQTSACLLESRELGLGQLRSMFNAENYIRKLP